MAIENRAETKRVRLSLDVPQELHTALKVAATRRRLSMSELLREILENALVVLGEGSFADEDLDSLAVRRELAAASIAALGDFWDNAVDAQWQTFQP
jgi:plasmid stability protein